MLLNFQRGFAANVWLGKKRQTIRAMGNRRDVPKVGDLAHCYSGLRTANAVQLGRWLISRVDVISFSLTECGMEWVSLNGNAASVREFNALATADGFESGAAMNTWFKNNHAPGAFMGWVVAWDWCRKGQTKGLTEAGLKAYGRVA